MTVKNSIIGIFLLAMFSTIACSSDVKISNRSGDLEDDYVSEPISERSKKYSNALDKSNVFINLLKKEDYETIYNDILSSEMQNKVSLESFSEMFQKMLIAKGKVAQYKEGQWGFIPFEQDSINLVASTKIVEHERGIMKYHFLFKDDGKYENIFHVDVREREGVSASGEF